MCSEHQFAALTAALPDRSVIDDESVGDDEHPPGALGDVLFVRDHDDGPVFLGE